MDSIVSFLIFLFFLFFVSKKYLHLSHVKNEQQYLVVAFKLFVGSEGIVMLLIAQQK